MFGIKESWTILKEEEYQEKYCEKIQKESCGKSIREGFSRVISKEFPKRKKT